MRVPWKSLLLCGAASLFWLAALEAGCRVVDLVEERAAERELRERQRVPRGSDVGMHVLIEPSDDPKLVYGLRPGLDLRFRGQRVTTSSAGFRDREYRLQKPPGVRRILGIGDSVMFGWGVADGEDYLAVLEERLARERSESYEVINLAVPGYNGVMEVEALETKGLAYQPDLVVVGFCGNDLRLPNFLIGRKDHLSLQHSWLLHYVGERLNAAQGNRWVPPQFAALAGLEAYEAAMTRLQELAGREGFDVLVLFYPGPVEPMQRIAQRLGFARLGLQRAVQRFHDEHGGREEGRRLLQLSEVDPHPTVVGHRLIADGLFDYLAASGTLDRLARKGGAAN